MSCSLAHLHQQGSRYKALKDRVEKERLHMLVTVKVELDIEPTEQERVNALIEYQEWVEGLEPTPEDLEAWIHEEVAFQRLDRVRGVIEQTIVDNE